MVKEEKPEESDSDQEGPIATQMLSFVMDDPDFESEDSDSQKKKMVNNSPCCCELCPAELEGLRYCPEQSLHLISPASAAVTKQPAEFDVSTNPVML